MLLKTPSLLRFGQILCAFCLLSTLVACGEDDAEPVQSERLSDAVPMPSGDPLTLSAENRATSLYVPRPAGGSEYRGDIYQMRDSSALEIVTSNTNTAVVNVQVIDEREAIAGGDANLNLAPYQSTKRLRDLYGEVDAVLGDRGIDDWDQYVLVFDLFRHNGTWLLRWNGVRIDENEGPGNYGLWRDDMRQDLQSVITASVAEAVNSRNLTHVVIGRGMERLLTEAESGGALNPTEFGNFVSFYEEVRKAIKNEFPDVKVSAGLNWDRFMHDVAPIYGPGASDGEMDFANIRAAWNDVGEALYADSDFIALSTSPRIEDFERVPGNMPDSYYALLHEVQGDRPVVWHSINWPTTSKADTNIQRDFLLKFLELNAGVEVDVVAWSRIFDLFDGEHFCRTLINVGAPTSECFAGAFSDSLAPTNLSEEFFEAGE